jgi:hypothetical protein
MWNTAQVVSIPTVDSNCRPARILATEAQVLRKIFMSLYSSFERIDPSVTAYRSKQQFSPKTFVSSIQIAREKVDLYGQQLADVFNSDYSNEFFEVLHEHLEYSPLKFRILLRNPDQLASISSPQTSCVKMEHSENVKKLLSRLKNIRDGMSDKRKFDKRCQIRVHNRQDYFEYFRFDDFIYVSHAISPSSTETSFIHQHHKKNKRNGNSQSSAIKDFKIAFKTAWEESVPIVASDCQVFK